jgi:integrase
VPPPRSREQKRGQNPNTQSAPPSPAAARALALLLTTGLRRSELLGLTLDALDLEAATLTVQRTVTETRTAVVVREITKTKSSRRTLAIPAAVVTLLRAQKARVLEQALAWGSEYASGPRFLFPVIGGAPMRPLNLTARLRRLLRRAGIKGVQPVHGWRHATATLLIAGGADVKTTQSRLGHSSPTITLALYTDKVDERDRAAGEALADYLTPRNRA